MDLITLATAKNYTNKIAAGITAARVEGNSIILTLVDGSEAKCTLPTPKDGISVLDLSIDKDGSLLCHMSDGSVIDAGYVPTVDPDLTNYYTKEEANAAFNKPVEILRNYSNYLASDEKKAFMQKAVDLMKEGKTVLIYVQGSNGSGYFDEAGIFVSPDIPIDEIDSKTQITFKTPWFYQMYDHSYRKSAMYQIPTWLELKVSVSAGIVTSVGNMSRQNHNNTTYGYEVPVLSKNNEVEYTPTKDYHPATKKYAEDASLNTIINHMSAEEFTYHDTNSIPKTTYEVSKLGTNDYEFVLDETTGYYISNNKGVHNSYALSKVNIVTDKFIRIKVSYINYSQSYYDYGIFSNLDTELTDSATADTENVFKTTKSSSQTSAVREFYLDVPAGEHFFTVKYIKDRTTSYNDDTLQFKVETICELVTSTLASKKYVDDITGVLDSLPTENKSNIVAAITELANNASSYTPFENLGNIGSVTLNAYGTYYIDKQDSTSNITVYCNAEGNNRKRTIKGGGILIYMPTNSTANKDYGTLIHIGWIMDIYYYGSLCDNYNSAVKFNVQFIDEVTKNQNITGTKTFLTLPETSIAPTTDNQFVNKKYVDDAIAAITNGDEVSY